MSKSMSLCISDYGAAYVTDPSLTIIIIVTQYHETYRSLLLQHDLYKPSCLSFTVNTRTKPGPSIHYSFQYMQS